MKQKDCFPAILSDGQDASPDLLHQFYGLLTPIHEPAIIITIITILLSSFATNLYTQANLTWPSLHPWIGAKIPDKPDE